MPKFPKVNDLSDLTDGVAIASVMSLYCSEGLPWSSVALGDPPSMADSLYNIQLLQRFCKDSLPFNVCHLSIEDIVYMHDSIRQNVLCFLTDLYVGLEVRPVIKSDQLKPGVKKDRIIEVPDPGKKESFCFLLGRIRFYNYRFVIYYKKKLPYQAENKNVSVSLGQNLLQGVRQFMA